jgi:penicillin-binding protein 1C
MKALYRLWRSRLSRLQRRAGPGIDRQELVEFLSHLHRSRKLRKGIAAAVPLFCAVFLLTALFRAHLEAPRATFLLRDRQARFLGEVGAPADGELGYWPVATLPPRVVAATLALEDRHFDSHPGVDPRAVGRALLQNLRRRKRISGASTLAMQIARMQSPGDRGYLRKATEALTAVFLTARYGRAGILRHYLKIVPYGNRIHGIAYAARRYFDKPVDDLSWAEIAFLAGIPQAPGKMNVFTPEGRRRAIVRGQQALRTLAATGVLSPPELELAERQLDALVIPWKGRRAEESLHAVLRLQAVLQEESRHRRLAPLVQTTLDLDLQREVSTLTDRAVRNWADRGAGNAAVIVLDLPSREVRAWVGSAGYFDPGTAGAIDYARIHRSAGSALKPFLYALALDRGVIRPSTVLDDLERGPGGITNADDLFLGPLLPRVALANSRNVPAVDLLARLGLEQGYGMFRDLGLTDGSIAARRYGLGIAIGGLPVTLEAMVNAYLVLAGDGRTSGFRWHPGQVLPPPKRIVSEETARQIALFLSDPQARLPTFPRMGNEEYRFPVAVKTGTSTSFRDAWAVAWSGRYLVGVWVGHPAFRPMNRLSGYLSAAELAQQVLSVLHKDQLDGFDDLSFPPPRGYRPVRVCALTGARAGDACQQVFLEWFKPADEPTDDCTAHQLRAIDRRNGLLATADTPRAEVEVRPFVSLPPRYAAWQLAANLPHPPDEVSFLSPGAVSPLGRAAGPSGPSLAVNRPARLHITSPEHRVRLLRDPETPPELSTVALTVIVDPPVRQVVWYVDGVPYETVNYPYTTRWRLAPGEHTFQVRVPFTTDGSPEVRVIVQ